VRLYHYTGAPAQVIRDEGIRMDAAKGHSYGEPNLVWASTALPEVSHKVFAEFAIKAGDPRMDIGAYQPGIKYGYVEGDPDRPGERTPEGWAKSLTARGANVTFLGDIKPEEIIAVHEPWHQAYHHIKENPDRDFDWSWRRTGRRCC
jgi:hypothetical protein